MDNVCEILDDFNSDVVEFFGDFCVNNFFNEEVFVFIFKGDMKIFFKGFIVLDFVFNIYIDIGYYCMVIKVNNWLVLMGYKFKNGD